MVKSFTSSYALLLLFSSDLLQSHYTVLPSSFLSPFQPLTQGKSGVGVCLGKNEVEWTGKVENTKEEIPGSGRSCCFKFTVFMSPS